MTVVFVPARRLHALPEAQVEDLPEGGRRAAPGRHGLAFYGPYIPAANGVHRVRVLAKVDGPPGAQAYFDVFDVASESRLYAVRSFHDGLETYVRVYDTHALEFRFGTYGHALVVGGVEFEPLLLDAQVAAPDDLRRLIDRVAAAGGEQAALYRLIDRLADAGDPEGAEAHRGRDVAARALAHAPSVRVHRALAALHGRPGAADDEPPLTPGDIRAAVEPMTFTDFDLMTLTAEAKAELESRGYSAALLNATRLHRDYDEPERVWHERPPASRRAGDFPPRHPLFERRPDIERGFQASLARGEGIAAHCPITGEALRSRHGFLQTAGDVPFVFWRFEGAEPFYLCTGDISNMRYFVFLPLSRTVVWLTDAWNRGYRPEHLIRALFVNLLENRAEVADYLAGETRPAAVIGSNNYGHYFWTSLSGLDYAQRSGLFEGLAALVKVDRQFADPVEIYPELAALPAAYPRDQASAFRHALHERLAPIHFTDVDLPPTLVERLRALARRKHTPVGQPPADLPRPCLWINLRSHNKAWVDQVEGYSKLLNVLYQDHGALSVFFDGVADCAPILQDIRARTRPDVVFFDGLRMDFYDTLNWALEVDAYIGVIGSGLVIINALAGKPGVAHANHMHLGQMSWWPATFPSEHPPVTPSLDQVHQIGEGDYASYDLDWRVLLALVRGVLARTWTGGAVREMA